ncbi:FecR family protein [Yersinia vastinensis]|uniref:FecR family protein n=1 Tax=Yersinia vastinensis TaxID=2890318 RepID=UPI0005DA78B4|nr:FecR domain-containing protein [Yersinia vastinensis]CNI10977.1 putative two-component system sensor protein [Yersinia frederiksenii]CNK97868.1 putative two-component system sensor protein [Yersinia frederiksenii]
MHKTTHNPDGGVAQIQQDAAQWLLHFSEVTPGSPEHNKLLDAWYHWCQQNEQHEKIYQQMSGLWQSMSPEPVRRRSGLRVSIWLALMVSGLLLSQLPYRYWLADQRTALGEIKHISLDDGSEIILNSNSAVDIDYSSGQRLITLRRGEVYAIVAKDDAKRPFVVSSRDAQALAMGTRYTVEQQVAETHVAVVESTVAVSANENPQVRVLLAAGQQISLNKHAITRPISVNPNADSWVQNQLIFENASLEQVIEQLTRYRAGLMYIDPRSREVLSQLRFTGVLPATDSDQALNLLGQSLPLNVNTSLPGIVWLSKK